MRSTRRISLRRSRKPPRRTRNSPLPPGMVYTVLGFPFSFTLEAPRMLTLQKPVHQISRSRASEFLWNETEGRIFSVYFRKRNGEMREMRCKRRVTKHLRGGELPYSPKAKLLLPVFDMDIRDYRMVPLDRLISFNIGTDPEIGSETFILA